MASIIRVDRKPEVRLRRDSMTARDEKWESAFNHLHGLSKDTARN